MKINEENYEALVYAFLIFTMHMFSSFRSYADFYFTSRNVTIKKPHSSLLPLAAVNFRTDGLPSNIYVNPMVHTA